MVTAIFGVEIWRFYILPGVPLTEFMRLFLIFSCIVSVPVSLYNIWVHYCSKDRLVYHTHTSTHASMHTRTSTHIHTHTHTHTHRHTFTHTYPHTKHTYPHTHTVFPSFYHPSVSLPVPPTTDSLFQTPLYIS